MRILLTRAREDSERTAKKLAALGHEAVIAPVLRIAPTGDPIPAGACDALIVTSAHGVEALSSYADKDIPVFSVGERTTDALRATGFTSITTAEGDAESLSRLIRDNLQPPRRLLHVTARHHKEEPAASLRAAGFTVPSWEAYEAEAAPALPEAAVEALRTGKIAAVLHYSRRSADLFVQLAGRAGLQSAILGCLHLCLSADVSAPLAAAGAATRIAGGPHEDALLELVRGL
ncbi:uroporphyrinogen-III synthase [Microvirga makkahensis]|uniref:Uroporphyrinogen-III synthase n=1 Tax=Microvirga makkahensis TaxID=1128670 RepID=A0A7X3SRG5_9HYPH|nr:uroporphyrinogen-III synthase [Microvirga makkahensis]MXQ14552.1 uroporphyrinogen-III synthase [Microvirga makkahensis]